MTPSPRNATFAMYLSQSCSAFSAERAWRERRLFGIEGKVFRPDHVVGAVGDHLGDGRVEQLDEIRVGLAQADAETLAAIDRQGGEEPAADLALARGEEIRQSEVVAEHVVDPLGQK